MAIWLIGFARIEQRLQDLARRLDLIESRKLNELMAEQSKFKVDPAHLVKLLISHFSRDEIDLLAFDMGIEPDEIKGATKGSRALSLVIYCKHHKLLSQLILNAQEVNPLANWPLLPKE